MQARLRRSERNSERECDLRQGQVEIVVKDDEGPRLRLEAAEAAVDLVAVGHDGSRVVVVGVIDRGQVHIEAMAPQPAFTSSRTLAAAASPAKAS